MSSDVLIFRNSLRSFISCADLSIDSGTGGVGYFLIMKSGIRTQNLKKYA